MQLSKILKELQLQSGHLGRTSVLDLSKALLRELGVISWGDLAPRVPMSKFKSKFRNKIIGKVGEFSVIKAPYSSRQGVAYYLVDLNQDAYECTVGKIETYKVAVKGAYSAGQVFGFTGNIRQVSLSDFADEYRGKGLGSKLYDAVWDDSDAFFSDEILYEGSYAMWAHHIMRNAGFFGIMVGDSGAVIPLSPEDALNKDLMGQEDVRSFIAIKDPGNVPAPVRKMAHNLKGVDIAKQLVVCGLRRDSINKKLKNGRSIDFVEGFTNVPQLLRGLERLGDDDVLSVEFLFNYPSAERTTAVLLFSDATLVVKTQGGQLVTVLI